MAPLQTRKPFDWKNFGVRVLSALILAPLALGAVWLGGPAFLLLIAVGTALLTIEWGAMCDKETPARASAIMASAVLVAVFAAYLGHPWIGWLLVGLGALAGSVIALVRQKLDRPADIAFGVLYIGAPVVALVWLREGAPGRDWTLLLIAVVWSADVGAYLVGNALKGPKLWPRFSPNKTWSGFFGGLVGGMVAATAVAALFKLAFPAYAGPPLASAIWIGLLGALAAMAGDLWESALKRRFGVKDSGDLIPGHGGLLDRVDGLMFAAVLVAAVRLMFFQGLFR